MSSSLVASSSSPVAPVSLERLLVVAYHNIVYKSFAVAHAQESELHRPTRMQPVSVILTEIIPPVFVDLSYNWRALQRYLSKIESKDKNSTSEGDEICLALPRHSVLFRVNTIVTLLYHIRKEQLPARRVPCVMEMLNRSRDMLAYVNVSGRVDATMTDTWRQELSCLADTQIDFVTAICGCSIDLLRRMVPVVFAC
jgi:hypothetical protein